MSNTFTEGHSNMSGRSPNEASLLSQKIPSFPLPLSCISSTLHSRSLYYTTPREDGGRHLPADVNLKKPMKSEQFVLQTRMAAKSGRGLVLVSFREVFILFLLLCLKSTSLQLGELESQEGVPRAVVPTWAGSRLSETFITPHPSLYRVI